MKFGTKAIHAGIKPDPSTGAVMTPIFQTTTYAQTKPGEHKGYEYSRTHNPTRTALEKNLAELENGNHCLAFSSGMAATDSVIKLLNPGDEVISTNDLYGGSYRIFTEIFQPLGIEFKFTDLSSANNLESLMGPKTKMIWIETPTNPLLRIIDIKAVVDLASEKGILIVVDNTFATPFLQSPLDLGADIVVHSVTKYLGGHSDVVMGATVVKDEKLSEDLAFIQNSCGGVPSPNDCFLVLRGIKTLHLRMQRHCESAEKIARHLKSNPNIQRVIYPGFEDHPGHRIAANQMRGFGGMVSFVLKNDSEDYVFSILEKFKVFTLAESLGGVESLVGHPATMTHASIPREERLQGGLPDSLIRLSIGIEDVEDLLEDLDQALR
jgi:cystathionine beta-lyase/cystathionine gamma-synthase